MKTSFVTILLYEMNGIAVRSMPTCELNKGSYHDTIN